MSHTIGNHLDNIHNVTFRSDKKVIDCTCGEVITVSREMGYKDQQLFSLSHMVDVLCARLNIEHHVVIEPSEVE